MDDIHYISIKSLKNIRECFVNIEEKQEFLSSLWSLIDELSFQIKLMNRAAQENVDDVAMTQVCLMTLFFRDNFELFRDMMGKIELVNPEEEDDG